MQSSKSDIPGVPHDSEEAKNPSVPVAPSAVLPLTLVYEVEILDCTTRTVFSREFTDMV